MTIRVCLLKAGEKMELDLGATVVRAEFWPDRRADAVRGAAVA
jgi:hypothetical protein